MSFHVKFCPETDKTNPAEFNKITNDMQNKICSTLQTIGIMIRTK